MSQTNECCQYCDSNMTDIGICTSPNCRCHFPQPVFYSLATLIAKEREAAKAEEALRIFDLLHQHFINSTSLAALDVLESVQREILVRNSTNDD